MAMIASFTGGVYYFGETVLARALVRAARSMVWTRSRACCGTCGR
jgi:hypothetical protein